MNSKALNTYFVILFSIIPLSIIIGPAVSLINILLIDFSFILLFLYEKNYKFLSNRAVKFIIFLSLYLIFNSIIAKDFSISIQRNFGFIRFGLLFLAFNYFFYNRAFLNRVLIVWTFTLLILTLDIYVENIFGKNILGYGEAYGQRTVSFFKDEPIAGGYVNGFYLIIIGYLFYLNNKYSSKYKNIILIFSIFFVIAILLTGERSNTIKGISGFFLFYYFNNFFKFKEKIIFVLLLIALATFLLNSSDFLKKRYIGQILLPIKYVINDNKTMEQNELVPIAEAQKIENNTYIKHYTSALLMFKNYPIFGVGNKNYRIEACSNKKKLKYICNTHPHQLYFEFLAEHGLAGSMIIIFILFNLIFSKVKIILNSKNYLQLGCLMFLSTSFIPLLPSGAFFADYNLTILWVNLSIMYAVGKKTNIYRSN